MAAFEAGMRVVAEAPDFYRQLMRLFLTSPEARDVRTRIEDGYIAIMASNLGAAKAAGQLAEWAEPITVARHMFALYMAAFLAWGIGELDFEAFRATALSGIGHLCSASSAAPFAEAEEVQARLREHQHALPPRLSRARVR